MINTLPATPDPLAGHTVMQMLDVAVSSIIGVKDDSAYEYTLNLAMELDAIPPALQPLLTAAQQAGVNYILFYNG
ncbi:hypothetical protein [Aeromonas enteropelogenes]|uniref:hypothetical protein n=1 Tax=Aeromonas enteropelogenes TaxID=29489 RepID=UPI003B9FBE3A